MDKVPTKDPNTYSWNFCPSHGEYESTNMHECPACQESEYLKQKNITTNAIKSDLRKQTLIDYLRMKTDEHDWHAVSDAANDLRVLEAKGG